MARYEIEFRKSVDKDVREILANDLRKILLEIVALRDDPRPPESVKLAGDERHRVRQGNYRIVYEIQETKLFVTVIRIGHRREGCRSSATGY